LLDHCGFESIFLYNPTYKTRNTGFGKLEAMRIEVLTEAIKLHLAVGFWIFTNYKRNLNLNSWLVSNGYAVAYRKYSKKYISNEINAKNEKKGLWQGKFEMPWDFRKKK